MEPSFQNSCIRHCFGSKSKIQITLRIRYNFLWLHGHNILVHTTYVYTTNPRLVDILCTLMLYQNVVGNGR